MTTENQNAGAENPTALDAAAIRNEIKESQTAILNNVQSMLAGFESRFNAVTAAPAAEPRNTSYSTDEDLADEIEGLGLDDKQLKSLDSFVKKVVEKNIAPKIKGEMRNEAKDAELNAKISEKLVGDYPDLLRAGSPLIQMTQAELNKLDPSIKNTPYGKQIAVTNAASILGIYPTPKFNPHNTPAASNPSGEHTPSEGDAEKAENEALLNFTSMFGITKDDLSKGIAHYDAVKKLPGKGGKK